jgi:hypothetical protein
LVPEVISGEGQEHTIGYLRQHLVFLQGCGLLRLTGRLCHVGLCTIELTAQGNMFVQPELAEFQKGSLLPQVIDSIEKRLQILSYPDEEKNGMIFRLREAIANQTPDIIAKVITEIGFRIAAG